MDDRRIFERLDAKLRLRYLDVHSGQEGDAETFDLSAKGVGLVVNSELKVRTPLELWLEVVNGNQPFYTRGEVVWSKYTGSGEYRAGVNLEKADLLGLSRALRTV